MSILNNKCTYIKKINDKIFLLTIGHILFPRKTWVSRLKSTLPQVSSENFIMILLSSKPHKSTVSPNTLSTIKMLTPSILSFESGNLWHGIISFFLWQQLAKLTKKKKTESLVMALATRSTVKWTCGAAAVSQGRFTVNTQGPVCSPMRAAQTGQWSHQRNSCLLLCHKQKH